MDSERNGLRIRDKGEQGYHIGLQRLVDSGEEEIWNEVESLMVRKSYHVSPGYVIPPADRVRIAQLSAYYSTGSVALQMGLEPSTCINVVKEATAAIAYRNSGWIGYDDLDDFGKRSYATFKRIEENRLALMPILQNDRVLQLLDRAPYLGIMLSRQLEDGAITPYLKELGFNETPVLMNSYFYNFSTRGERDTGMQVWLRKALYCEWLNSNKTENCFGVYVPDVYERLIGSVENNNVVKENKTAKTLFQNLQHFSNFLHLDSSSGDGFLIRKLREFAIMVTNYNRGGVIAIMAQELGLSEQSTRKIYDTGIRTLDYLLTAKTERHDPKALYWYLKKSEVIRVFDQYINAVQSIVREQG